MPRFLAVTIVVVLLPGALVAAGKKAPPLTVSFHLQANPGESTKTVFKQLTAGKEITYRTVPEISTRDITAFRSFPSDDGQSYGAVFQLNKVAANRLRTVSTAHRGKFLLAVVNGQVRDAVVIDKPVSDGLIVIWKWITLNEVRQADLLIPRIGEDPKVWKKRIKEQKKKK